MNFNSLDFCCLGERTEQKCFIASGGNVDDRSGTDDVETERFDEVTGTPVERNAPTICRVDQASRHRCPVRENSEGNEQ